MDANSSKKKTKHVNGLQMLNCKCDAAFHPCLSDGLSAGSVPADTDGLFLGVRQQRLRWRRGVAGVRVDHETRRHCPNRNLRPLYGDGEVASHTCQIGYCSVATHKIQEFLQCCCTNLRQGFMAFLSERGLNKPINAIGRFSISLFELFYQLFYLFLHFLPSLTGLSFSLFTRMAFATLTRRSSPHRSRVTRM